MSVASDVEIIQSDTETLIQCGDVIDISMSTTFFSQLLPTLRGNKKISINALSVERCDTAALQLFIAFISKLKESNLSIAVEWSPVIIEAAQVLGLSSQLCIDDKV